MDEHIFEMFGTNLLPTPFRAETPAETVAAHIEKLNPGAAVWVIA